MMRGLAIAALVAAIAVGLWSTRPAPRAGITPQVSGAFAAVNALGPGDVMVLTVDFDPASVPELSPFMHLVLDAALMRGARVVTLSLSPSGAMLAERHLRQVLAGRRAVYGRDALNLGFIEGRSTVAHLFAMPLQRVVTRDHAGAAIADLPLAHDIARLADCTLLALVTGGTPGAKDWMLQAQGRFAPSMLVATTGNEGPELTPFFASGQLTGLVSGARDVSAFADLAALDHRLNADPVGASYVRTLKEQMRAQRWAHLLLVLCLAGGQAWFIWSRRKRGDA